MVWQALHHDATISTTTGLPCSGAGSGVAAWAGEVWSAPVDMINGGANGAATGITAPISRPRPTTCFFKGDFKADERCCYPYRWDAALDSQAILSRAVFRASVVGCLFSRAGVFSLQQTGVGDQCALT